MKFNYNFNIERPQGCYDSIMQLSKDCKKIILTKKQVLDHHVPIEEDHGIYSADYHQQKLDYTRSKLKNIKIKDNRFSVEDEV